MAFGNKNQKELYEILDAALTEYKKDRAPQLKTRITVTYQALNKEKLKPIFNQPDFKFWVEAQLILNQLSNGKQNSAAIRFGAEKWNSMAALKTFVTEFEKDHMKTEMKRPAGAIMSKVIRILKEYLETIYDTGMDNVPQLDFLWRDGQGKTWIWYFRFKNAALKPEEAVEFCTVIEKHGISSMRSMEKALKRFVYNRFCRALRATKPNVRDVPEGTIEFWNGIWAALANEIKREEEWDNLESSTTAIRGPGLEVPEKPKDLIKKGG